MLNNYYMAIREMLNVKYILMLRQAVLCKNPILLADLLDLK